MVFYLVFPGIFGRWCRVGAIPSLWIGLRRSHIFRPCSSSSRQWFSCSSMNHICSGSILFVIVVLFCCSRCMLSCLFSSCGGVVYSLFCFFVIVWGGSSACIFVCPCSCLSVFMLMMCTPFLLCDSMFSCPCDVLHVFFDFVICSLCFRLSWSLEGFGFSAGGISPNYCVCDVNHGVLCGWVFVGAFCFGGGLLCVVVVDCISCVIPIHDVFNLGPCEFPNTHFSMVYD